MEMREALQEKEQEKSLKSKMREKVRPKLGKIDIDYQKLHDAFFKWQTKPRMTYHGDLYYEGKEFEIRLKEKKPGDLTDDLRTALGMPVGPNAHKVCTFHIKYIYRTHTNSAPGYYFHARHLGGSCNRILSKGPFIGEGVVF